MYAAGWPGCLGLTPTLPYTHFRFFTHAQPTATGKHTAITFARTMHGHSGVGCWTLPPHSTLQSVGSAHSEHAFTHMITDTVEICRAVGKRGDQRDYRNPLCSPLSHTVRYTKQRPHSWALPRARATAAQLRGARCKSGPAHPCCHYLRLSITTTLLACPIKHSALYACAWPLSPLTSPPLSTP